MDTGIDKKQIEAIKRFGRRLATEPARLRLAVCIVFAGVGIFAIDRPLGERLARARADNKAAHATARMAEEAVFFTKQRAEYDERVGVEADIANWQNYVLEKLRCTTATLISIEPRKPVAKGPFTVLEMEVVVKGRSYQEFADFVDRVEHGERIVRIDRLRMERQQTSIHLTCVIKGLVKSAAKDADGKGSSKARPATKKDAPAEPADDGGLWVGPTLADAPTTDGAPPAEEPILLVGPMREELPADEPWLTVGPLLEMVPADEPILFVGPLLEAPPADEPMPFVGPLQSPAPRKARDAAPRPWEWEESLAEGDAIVPVGWAALGEESGAPAAAEAEAEGGPR